MDVALGSFFLNVLKEIRDVITKEKAAKRDLVALGTFLELYGSATRLQGFAERIHAGPAESASNTHLGDLLTGFFDELIRFGEILRRANLYAIEIFHPELAHELRLAAGMDVELSYMFVDVISPQFNLKAGKLEKLARLYVDFSDDRYEISNIEYHASYYGSSIDAEEPYFWSRFEELSGHLEDFCKVIGDVVRKTWDFKELATLPTQRHR